MAPAYAVRAASMAVAARNTNGMNQTTTAYAVTAASMAVAARNTIRGGRCGVKSAHTRKVSASSGATRILSTERPAHIGRCEGDACLPATYRMTAARPVTATARHNRESTVQNCRYDLRKYSAAPVGRRASTPKTATKTMESPNAYMPPAACASGPLVAMRMATAADAARKAAT